MNIATDRQIPMTTTLSILFGGILNLSGWITFGFGLIFVWVFTMNADLSFIHFTGEILTVKGIVTASRDTGASVNERPVFEHHYTFRTHKDVEYKGVSYSTGGALNIGETATIEYPEGKPHYSRIQGMRRQEFGPAVLVITLIPAVSLVLIAVGLKKALRALRLLRHGELTTGTLISKAPTNIRVNKQPVYKLTFRFTDHLGNDLDVSANTHEPHRLEDEREEQLVYSTHNPTDAIMLGALPSSPSIREDGTIEASPGIQSLFCLIIAVMVLVGHGYYIFVKFIK
jgi:hypothetical protein